MIIRNQFATEMKISTKKKMNFIEQKKISKEKATSGNKKPFVSLRKCLRGSLIANYTKKMEKEDIKSLKICLEQKKNYIENFVS